MQDYMTGGWAALQKMTRWLCDQPENGRGTFWNSKCHRKHPDSKGRKLYSSIGYSLEGNSSSDQAPEKRYRIYQGFPENAGGYGKNEGQPVPYGKRPYRACKW